MRTPPQGFPSGVVFLSDLPGEVADSPMGFNLDIGLRKWRAALAKLQGGESAKYRVFGFGDSHMAGIGATAPRDGGFFGLLRDYFIAKSWCDDNGKGTVSSLAPYNELGSSLYTYSEGWQVGWGITTGMAKCSAFTNVNGAAVTIPWVGTGVNIQLVASWGSGTSLGSVSISTDGGAADVVDLAATGAFVHNYAKTGLSDASHTTVVTAVLDAGEYVLFTGHTPIKGAKGLVFDNMAISGATAEMCNGDQVWYATYNLYSPVLTIISLGGNDWNTGVTLATYMANLNALVDKALTYGDVLLEASGAFMSTATPSGTPTATRAAFRDAMKSIALAKDCAFVDLMAAHGDDADNLDDLGLLADTVHFNDYGQHWAFNYLITALE